MRVRFDVRIAQAGTGKAVAEGHAVCAFVDRAGKPVRPPEWFVSKV